METFSALLALCARNSPATGEFPSQRPVTRSFDVFFDLRLNKRLTKKSWGWWFETSSRSLWRHCNESCSWTKTHSVNTLCKRFHKRYDLALRPHWSCVLVISLYTQIAKTIWSTSPKHRSDTFALDWYLIDVDPRVVVIWVECRF